MNQFARHKYENHFPSLNDLLSNYDYLTLLYRKVFLENTLIFLYLLTTFFYLFVTTL